MCLKLSVFKIYHKFVNDSLVTERTTVNISDDKKKIATAETLTIDQGSLTVDPVAIIRYQYDNHLGSASLELDESADIISYEEYHPFGTTSYRSGRTETETSLKRYKYVGKERDEETGLYYYGFRYYAAWICRFVSVDPLQFEYPQLTPFNYAGNKPVTHIDIDGLQSSGDEKRNVFTIEQGDTFWGIENSLGLDHGSLQKLNPGIDPLSLQVGANINISPQVGATEIRDISGLNIGLVNFDFAAISVTGEYVIHPIIGGSNAGNWLVRRYYMNEMYEDVLIGGKRTFQDLVKENFIVPEETFLKEESVTARPRTALEFYRDITNEEKAMTNYFENPSWGTIGQFAYKRALNQFTNPMNYLRLKAGNPRVFKANLKFSRTGFREFRNNNPRPKGMTFKGKGRRAARNYDKKIYRDHLDGKAEKIGLFYDNWYNTLVSDVKTTLEILNKNRNE